MHFLNCNIEQYKNISVDPNDELVAWYNVMQLHFCLKHHVGAVRTPLF